jgi:xanthine dehydrogenase YagT iron-sulfur-binding subunit
MAWPDDEIHPSAFSRRDFLQTAATAAGAAALPMSLAAQPPARSDPSALAPIGIATAIKLHVNGVPHEITVEPRVTLLDALRERLQLMGTKKGCDRGQCGACTVLVDGRRINSCLSLAVMQENAEIVTVEGLARDGDLHPIQAAFLEHDALQCGYCTPGQICSAVGFLSERARRPEPAGALSDAEIREGMSGNICRCGAYPNIVAAIRETAGESGGKGA